MIYIWLAVVILLAIAEFMTVNLITIWYVISGIVTIIVSFFITDFYIQFGIFTVLGTLLLITTRPSLKKILKLKNEKTNADKIIGLEAVVVEKIDKNTVGKVLINGETWRAVSNDFIKKSHVVVIKDFEGNKVVVEEIR